MPTWTPAATTARGATGGGSSSPASWPGEPEMTEEGAGRHLDELASKYAGRPIRYFGDAIPARFAETEIPVLCRIRPTHVVALDASGSEGEP